MNVGKLQVVVSELHRLFSAAWQRLGKQAMNQATMVACFSLANIVKSQVGWGQHAGTVVLSFPESVVASPEDPDGARPDAAAVCSSLKAAVDCILSKLTPDVRSSRPLV